MRTSSRAIAFAAFCGASVLALRSADSAVSIAIVTPSDPQGWEDQGPGSTLFALGPATAPGGNGSLRFRADPCGCDVDLVRFASTSMFVGTSPASLTRLFLSTYANAGAESLPAIELQIDRDGDGTVDLVVRSQPDDDPIVVGTWQQHEAIGGLWSGRYASLDAPPTPPSSLIDRPFSDVLAVPGTTDASAIVQLSIVAAPRGGDVFADMLVVETASNNPQFPPNQANVDFEPGPEVQPDPPTVCPCPCPPVCRPRPGCGRPAWSAPRCDDHWRRDGCGPRRDRDCDDDDDRRCEKEKDRGCKKDKDGHKKGKDKKDDRCGR
jgi:hypothetical protein